MKENTVSVNSTNVSSNEIINDNTVSENEIVSCNEITDLSECNDNYSTEILVSVNQIQNCTIAIASSISIIMFMIIFQWCHGIVRNIVRRNDK